MSAIEPVHHSHARGTRPGQIDVGIETAFDGQRPQTVHASTNVSAVFHSSFADEAGSNRGPFIEFVLHAHVPGESGTGGLQIKLGGDTRQRAGLQEKGAFKFAAWLTPTPNEAPMDKLSFT